MRWSEIPFHPTTKTLRGFAVCCLIVFGGVGCWQYLEGRQTLAVLLLGAGLVLGSVGLVVPQAIRPVHVGLLIVTFPLNWLVTHLVLALVFYCLFTPLGLLFKVFGRDVLKRQFRPNQDSYWVAKPGAENVRQYFRQS